ncbi:MAG TPA: hypothetical protein ENK05_04915 [Gammaproteobacteria bacterium]|nr:hypothetical protein [Gammaproteobacteria bacterium]
MSNKTVVKPLAIALGATFIGSLAATGVANAAQNPFGMTELSSGYQVAEMKEGKCGAGKMKEGEKMKEGKCGAGKMKEGEKMKEGKCGAGKMKEQGGEMKMKEGKCGTGKCGANMKKKMEKSKEGKCGGSK